MSCKCQSGEVCVRTGSCSCSQKNSECEGAVVGGAALGLGAGAALGGPVGALAGAFIGSVLGAMAGCDDKDKK